MILPLLGGVTGLRGAPMTWTLVTLNVCCFILLQAQVALFDRQMNPYFTDDSFINNQGLVFAHYILKNEDRAPSSLLAYKATRSLGGDREAQQFLGRKLAFHDAGFLRDSRDLNLISDQVLLEAWRGAAQNFNELRFAHPTYNMGYHSRSESKGLALITYQFAHSGWMHLLLNMFFLLIFGRAVEPRLGPSKFLLFYLACGVLAAQAFMFFQWSTSSLPLVGASGAIGGLIGLALVLDGTKRTKFFYYFGVLQMPFWVWALYFWVLTDLTGWWRSLPELSSAVAHSAHLGGTLAGVVLGLAFKLLLRPSQLSRPA